MTAQLSNLVQQAKQGNVEAMSLRLATIRPIV